MSDMNDARIQMELDGVALRILYQAVNEAADGRWHDRDPNDQEELLALRSTLFAALLDVNYE